MLVGMQYLPQDELRAAMSLGKRGAAIDNNHLGAALAKIVVIHAEPSGHMERLCREVVS